MNSEGGGSARLGRARSQLKRARDVLRRDPGSAPPPGWSAPVSAQRPDRDAVTASRTAVERALADMEAIDLGPTLSRPEGRGMAMSSDALRFLTSLVRELQPRHVLEMGSGLSTLVLARACLEVCDDCRVTSVDNDPVINARTKSELEAVGHENTVRCLFAPLVARACVGEMRPVYLIEPESLASRRPADLVVIDGPPAVLGGRGGTLHQALEFSRPGTVVLMDDAERKLEARAMSQWRERLGDVVDLSVLTQFDKGLAVVIVHETPEDRLPRSVVEETRLPP